MGGRAGHLQSSLAPSDAACFRFPIPTCASRLQLCPRDADNAPFGGGVASTKWQGGRGGVRRRFTSCIQKRNNRHREGEG